MQALGILGSGLFLTNPAMHAKHSVSRPPTHFKQLVWQGAQAFVEVVSKYSLDAQELKHFPFCPSIFGYFVWAARAHFKQSSSAGPTQE